MRIGVQAGWGACAGLFLRWAEYIGQKFLLKVGRQWGGFGAQNENTVGFLINCMELRCCLPCVRPLEMEGPGVYLHQEGSTVMLFSEVTWKERPGLLSRGEESTETVKRKNV